MKSYQSLQMKFIQLLGRMQLFFMVNAFRLEKKISSKV